MKKLRALALGFLLVVIVTAFAANAPKETVFFYDAWKALKDEPDAIKEMVENAILNLLDSVTNFESMDLRYDISKRFPVDEPITQAEAAVIAARIFGVEEEIIKRYSLMATTFENLKCELEVKFEKEKASKPVVFDYSKLCGYFYFIQEFFRKNAGYTLFDNPDPLHEMTKGEFVKFLVRTFSLYSEALGFGRGQDYVKIANELENRLRKEYKLDVPNIGYITTFEFMFLTKEHQDSYAENPAKGILKSIIKLDYFTKNGKFVPEDPAVRAWAYSLTYYVFSRTPYTVYDSMIYSKENWPFGMGEPSKGAVEEPTLVYTLPITESNGEIEIKKPSDLKKFYSGAALKQIIDNFVKSGAEEDGSAAFKINDEAELMREKTMLYLAMAMVSGNEKAFEEFKALAKVASSSKLAEYYSSKGEKDIAEAFKEAGEDELFWNYKPDPNHFSYKEYFKAKAEEYFKKAEEYQKLAKKLLKTNPDKAKFLAQKMANYVVISNIFEEASKFEEDKASKWLEKIGGNALDKALYMYYKDFVPVKERNNVLVYKPGEESIAIYEERLNKQLNAKFVPDEEIPFHFKTKFESYSAGKFEPIEFFLPKYKNLFSAALTWPEEKDFEKKVHEYSEDLPLASKEPVVGILKGKFGPVDAKFALLDNTIIVDKLFAKEGTTEGYKHFNMWKEKLASQLKKLDDVCMSDGYLRTNFKTFVEEYLSKMPYWESDPKEEDVLIEINEKTTVKNPEIKVSNLKANAFAVLPKNEISCSGLLDCSKKWYDFLDNNFYIKLKSKREHGIPIYKIDIEKEDENKNLFKVSFKDAIIKVKDNNGVFSSMYSFIKNLRKEFFLNSSVRLWLKEFREKDYRPIVGLSLEMGGLAKIVIVPFDYKELAAKLYANVVKPKFDELLAKENAEGLPVSDFEELVDKTENLTRKRELLNKAEKLYEELKPEMEKFLDKQPVYLMLDAWLTSGEGKYYISILGILDMFAMEISKMDGLESVLKFSFDSSFKYSVVTTASYPVGALYKDIKVHFMPTFDRLNYERKVATLDSIKEFLEVYENDKTKFGFESLPGENFIGYWKDVKAKFANLPLETPIVGKLVIDGVVAEPKPHVEKVNKKDAEISGEEEFKGLKFSNHGALYSMVKDGESVKLFTEPEGSAAAVIDPKDGVKTVAMINVVAYDPTAINPDLWNEGYWKSIESLYDPEWVKDLKEVSGWNEGDERIKCLGGFQVISGEANIVSEVDNVLFDAKNTLRALHLWKLEGEGYNFLVLDEIYRIRK